MENKDTMEREREVNSMMEEGENRLKEITFSLFFNLSFKFILPIC
jgi:hypothetical protein